MRELHGHKTGVVNEALRVEARDEPGPGGANHHYFLEWDSPQKSKGSSGSINLVFQRGAVAEAGINGITNEALLAVVIDRLESFQRGPFACLENEMALTGVRAALDALKTRTADRIARGVERTLQT